MKNLDDEFWFLKDIGLKLMLLVRKKLPVEVKVLPPETVTIKDVAIEEEETDSPLLD